MSHRPTNQANALLLVGHGTRFEPGRDEFLTAVDLVRERAPETPIEPAFLELCEPDIPTAVARLAAAGVRRIIAQPVLLFAAGHARHDIPEALAAAVSRHGGLTCIQTQPLECHPALIQLSKQRFEEALRDSPPPEHSGDERRNAWLMVGRGSSDASALDEMQRFVDLRLEQTPVAFLQTCFFAVAQPRLEAGIEQAAAADVTHVVVQPHLLFQGDLMRRLRTVVDEAQQRHPTKIWRLADHLGPAPQLVDAILARSRSALLS